MEQIYYATTQTPWVELLVASSVRGLVAVSFVSAEGVRESLRRIQESHPKAAIVESLEQNRRIIDELAAYSAGELREFTTPLDLRGTPFQRSVWNALLGIPYGETRTYAHIARLTGHPKAFRAVGLANHSNPACIVVPCHRVIGSNGGLCGYGGGIELKQILLTHERQHKRTAIPALSAEAPLQLK